MNEISKNIGRLLNDVLPEKIYEALEKAGQIVENEAKKNCPVDTGALRASINHEVSEDGKSVVIGTNVEYAPYVHEQTKPFLQNAVDENIDRIQDCFKGLLEEVKLWQF